MSRKQEPEIVEGMAIPKCALCGADINGTYRTAQGGTYHPLCYSKLGAEQNPLGSVYDEKLEQWHEAPRVSEEAAPPMAPDAHAPHELCACGGTWEYHVEKHTEWEFKPMKDRPTPVPQAPPSVYPAPVPKTRRTRIYIAGASKDKDRVRAAMLWAAASGYVITCDWLAAIEKEGAANEGLDDRKRMRYAQEDMDGVLSADVLWLLAPDTASTGSWTELGMAIAANHFLPDFKQIKIVVSGKARERSIFASFADFESDSDVEGIVNLMMSAPATTKVE